MNSENTQYDDKHRFSSDESTQYDGSSKGKAAADESTQFDDRRFNDDEGTQYDEPKEQPQTAPVQPQKRSVGKRIAIAFGASAALGAGAAVLMSATPADTADGGNSDDIVNADHPEWTDGQVQVATTVDDSMSFEEAFNAARAEVGSGGVFEWHGYIYSTFTAEEWDSMSQEERDEYGSHFSWQGTTGEAEATATTTGGGNATATAATATTATSATATTAQGEGPDYTNGTHGGQAEVVPVSDDDIDDSGIEVLGVHHDSESGMTYASITAGGHDAVLIDIDSDDTFDVLAVDANGDGHISDNELIDISDDNVTAQSLGIDTGHHDAGTGEVQAGIADVDTDPTGNVIMADNNDIGIADDQSDVML